MDRSTDQKNNNLDAVLDEESVRALAECINLFARRGRELREEREGLTGKRGAGAKEGKIALEEETDLHCDLIPHEQAVVEVYDRYERGELPIAEMSVKELGLFDEESHRQIENTLWNAEHQKLFLERVYDLDKYLNEKERERIGEMLAATKWGDAEIAEVKSIIENAEWFHNLRRGAE